MEDDWNGTDGRRQERGEVQMGKSQRRERETVRERERERKRERERERERWAGKIPITLYQGHSHRSKGISEEAMDEQEREEDERRSISPLTLAVQFLPGRGQIIRSEEHTSELQSR